MWATAIRLILEREIQKMVEEAKTRVIGEQKVGEPLSSLSFNLPAETLPDRFLLLGAEGGMQREEGGCCFD